jgi:hypothetical protein
MKQILEFLKSGERIVEVKEVALMQSGTFVMVYDNDECLAMPKQLKNWCIITRSYAMTGRAKFGIRGNGEIYVDWVL